MSIDPNTDQTIFVNIVNKRHSTRFDTCEILHMADLYQTYYKNERVVYQLDFQLYYICWMNETNPKIFF
jgi:hypothetical protein